MIKVRVNAWELRHTGEVTSYTNNYHNGRGRQRNDWGTGRGGGLREYVRVGLLRMAVPYPQSAAVSV